MLTHPQSNDRHARNTFGEPCSEPTLHTSGGGLILVLAHLHNPSQPLVHGYGYSTVCSNISVLLDPRFTVHVHITAMP